MKKHKILLVEDDSTLSFILEDALIREGFEVRIASDGSKGITCFCEWKPDLVVADVMMPKMDGFEMANNIRNLSSTTPLLFLTARTAIEDVVKGFNLGGNDYIRKPFQIAELIVRINALLQNTHRTPVENGVIILGDCTLNMSSQILSVNHHRVNLSHLEAVILQELLKHPNEVVEANSLMFRAWQNDDYNNYNRLHGFIHKLRKYLSNSTQLDLLNIRGVGYKIAIG